MEIIKTTCIICPVGCELRISAENGSFISAEGNACPRGLSYARTEIENPRRTLTSTIRIKGGTSPVIPVKTTAPIPKNKLFEAIERLNRITVSAPVKMGDVIQPGFMAEGADLVVCCDMDKTP